MYYITVERDCALRHIAETEEVLPPLLVQHNYCCKNTTIETIDNGRLLITVPHGIMTREELRHISGVVRMRAKRVVRGRVVFEHC